MNCISYIIIYLDWMRKMKVSDIFAGTGIVGKTFKTSVKKVISNDVEYYSYVLNKNYIENHRSLDNKNELLDELNSLPLISDGFIYSNYCLGGNGERQYFSDNKKLAFDSNRTQYYAMGGTTLLDSNNW